ncbi:MAG TPA: hypothetical protein VLI39_14235 [Sedimentisphaerales bacterium]|nr:hypothetical protein [Sedimentisphaerales bacterium]
MSELDMLVPLAVKHLWACSYFIDERGEVTFDVDGLDSFLRSGCRMGARGQNSDYTLFLVASSPEEGNAACDALLSHMRKNAKARGKRGPRTLEDKLARWSRMCSSRRTREAGKVA